MATISFDTHKFIRKLEAAGLSMQQAEVIADAVKDAQGENQGQKGDANLFCCPQYSVCSAWLIEVSFCVKT